MLSQTEIRPTSALTWDKVEISRLINSIYYFIDIVFILKKDDKFRLIAFHCRRVLTDRSYKTIGGAKIVFSKLYSAKAWEENVKAQWTDFYPPDRPWLDEQLKIADKPEKSH